MSGKLVWMVTCYLLWCAASVQAAEAEHAGERVWRDVSGTYSVKAQFAGLENDRVKLRKSDGSEIAVQLEMLSAEDRAWVKTHANPSSRSPQTNSAKRKPAASRPPRRTTRVELRDGIIYCIMLKTKREHKIGVLENGQVKLFSTYGGELIALDDLESRIAFAGAGSGAGKRQEPFEIYQAILTPKFFGIWQLESVTHGRSIEVKPADDPSYLILRPDKSFRIIRRGKARDGTWRLVGSRLVTEDENGGTRKQRYRLRPDGSLELSSWEYVKETLLRYRPSGLKTEPAVKR